MTASLHIIFKVSVANHYFVRRYSYKLIYLKYRKINHKVLILGSETQHLFSLTDLLKKNNLALTEYI